MFKERPFNVLLICSLITVCTAIFQYKYPELGFLDSGLIAVIMLTIFLEKNIYTNLFGVVSLVLIAIPIFYPHDELDTKQILMQHAFSAAIIILATVSVNYVKRLYYSIESDQQQLEALFDNSTEGIILTNSKGEIVLINPAALRMFNYTKEELLGKNVEILIPMRFTHSHVDYREGFVKHPSHRSMGHGRDLFARIKDGREFPVEVSLSFYKQRGELYVIAFLVDITQRKESEKSLIQQKEQLEKVSGDIRKLNAELENKVEERTQILKEALQELEKSQLSLSEALDKEKELSEIKSRFVSMASHEFRTPLSTVLSSAALLGKYTQADEQDKRDRHIRRIKDSVKHLNDLLEDFLSLGKLEEGKIQAHTENFELKDFLEEVLEEIRALGKPGQVIELNYTGDGTFMTDKKLLKNILINLLSNAVKFSPENSTIQLNALRKDHELLLSVKDEGIGIPEDDLQHIFSSFFRGRNAVNIQGTGLGLHIVKRYVDLLNGEISIESIAEKGTTVLLELPFLGADNES